MFELKNIIEHYGLNVEKLARVLFPFVKYPKFALNRVLKGEGSLCAKQIETLANYIGVLPADLFSVNSWHGSNEHGCLIFIKGKYKAKLNYNGVYLSLYKNDTPIEQIVSDVPSMTVAEFINFLDNLIKNYKNGNN